MLGNQTSQQIEEDWNHTIIFDNNNGLKLEINREEDWKISTQVEIN